MLQCDMSYSHAHTHAHVMQTLERFKNHDKAAKTLGVFDERRILEQGCDDESSSSESESDSDVSAAGVGGGGTNMQATHHMRACGM